MSYRGRPHLEAPENPEDTTDEEDYYDLQDLWATEKIAVDAVSPVWEAPRADEESFRSYAARRSTELRVS